MPGVGAHVFNALGLTARLPPPSGPLAVASFRFRVPGENGVFTQIFFPASKTTEKYATADKKRRLAYRPEFLAGTAEVTKTSLHIWKCFLGKCKHVVPEFIPNSSDIAGTETYPMIFFSHGLMGCSDSYTKTCADLASYGFIVIALEHEDGSGCFARTENGQVLHYKFPPTPPQPRDVVKNFRAPFLAKRKQEVDHVVDFFLTAEPSSSGEVEGILARIDKSRLVIGGHSFGAASAVNIVRASPGKFNCVVLLDIWPFPLDLEEGLSGIPVFVISSDEFVRNDEAQITAQFVKNCDQLWASTYIPGSTHLSMGDATFWLPSGLAKKLKTCGTTPRLLTQKVMIASIVAFLKYRVQEGLQNAPEGFEESIIKQNSEYLTRFRQLVGTGEKKVRG